MKENVTGREHCEWCCPHPGWVVAYTRSEGGGEVEEMGPCPNCEIGNRIEMGEMGRRQWPRGFWQGRPTQLRRACVCDERVSTAAEVEQWKDFITKAMTAMIEKNEEQKVERKVDTGAVLAAVAEPDQVEGGRMNVTGGEPEHTPAPEVSDNSPNVPGATPDPGSATDTHECPSVTDEKGKPRTVPWSREECAACNPAQPEEVITL